MKTQASGLKFCALVSLSLSALLLSSCSLKGFETAGETELASIGQVLAYQDVSFSYTPVSTLTTPTYTMVNAPAWAVINPTTGLVSGLPSEPATFKDVWFVATKGSDKDELGPYTLVVVGDPLKSFQWHLKNTGQNAFAGHAGTADQDIHQASTIASGLHGSGIKIAISDTGVEETHKGLKDSLIAGASRNYLNHYASAGTWAGSASPGTTVSDYAHGTAVAGLAAERGWKGFGGRGVAPLASLAPFLFLQAQTQLTNEGYATAGLYDQFDGAFDIFNYSWGDAQCAMWEYEPALKYKMYTGVTSLRSGKGAVYVKAAGNSFYGELAECYDNTTASYLGNANFSEDATTPYTIIVGALTATGVSSSYSSPGSNVWISAPGGEYGYGSYSDSTSVALDPALVTTDFTGCGVGLKSDKVNSFDAGASPNGACTHTSTMNGTSGATPVVSGAVALLLNANPALTWRDVKYILAKTADKIDASSVNVSHPATSGALAGHVYEPGWITNTAGFHFHNWYGFGRVNVDAAVAMAKTYVSTFGTFRETNTSSPSAITWAYDSGTLNVAVTPGNATGISRTLTVTQAYTLEAVQIKLQATGCVGNLGVELTSPAGTKSVVMHTNSYLQDTSIAGHVFLSNAFYGEPSNGIWTLKLIGAKSSCTTTWNNWQLNVIGH